MLSEGWRVDEEQRADVLFFERDSDDDEPYRIWIWCSRESPKFVSRLQNLLFSLAVIEGREPLDVGNAILEHGELSTVNADDGVFRISVRNVDPVPLSVRIEGGKPSDQTLGFEDSVELLFRGPAGAAPEIVSGPHGIDVSCSRDLAVRVFQGLPASCRASSVNETVREEVQRGGLEPNALQSVLDDLQTVLARADFEFGADGEGSALSPVAAQRQTAIVLSALAKRLTGVESAPMIVWRTAARMVSSAELRLELTENAIPELFRVASEDDQAAPVETASWLKDATRSSLK